MWSGRNLTNGTSQTGCYLLSPSSNAGNTCRWLVAVFCSTIFGMGMGNFVLFTARKSGGCSLWLKVRGFSEDDAVSPLMSEATFLCEKSSGQFNRCPFLRHSPPTPRNQRCPRLEFLHLKHVWVESFSKN